MLYALDSALGDGIGRRRLRAVPGGPHWHADTHADAHLGGPFSGDGGDSGAASPSSPLSPYLPVASFFGLERPFVHSDLEPHVPVYQLAACPEGRTSGGPGFGFSSGTGTGTGTGGGPGVLVSVGRDRLLRLWDLRTGTPARCLPAAGNDVPVALGAGVLVAVDGLKGRAVSAWASASAR